MTWRLGNADFALVVAPPSIADDAIIFTLYDCTIASSWSNWVIDGEYESCWVIDDNRNSIVYHCSTEMIQLAVRFNII